MFKTQQLAPKCAVTSEYQSTLDEEESGVFAGNCCSFQSHVYLEDVNTFIPEDVNTWLP